MKPFNISGHRNFFRAAGLEILELHPNLFVALDLDGQRIEAAGGGAGPIFYLAGDIERALVARAGIDAAVWNKLDETARVRTHCVEGLDLSVFQAAQINCANRNLGELIPGI